MDRHPRVVPPITAGCLLAAVALGLAAGFGSIPAQEEPGPNAPDEPLAGRLSLDRAAAFLDTVALDWTRTRRCGTCHTNYNYLLARPAVPGGDRAAMDEVRAFFEGRVAGWDGDAPGARPRWDTEVVATAAALALNDAGTTGRLHPRTRQALDRMWTLQRADGAWNWLQCGWPPYEHDDYYGAAFAALGVGAAPEGYRDGASARRGLERLRRYLRETPPPSLHHEAMLLWAATTLDGLMTPAHNERTIAALLARQRPDGGWNLASLGDWRRRDGTPNDPSGPGDGFGTGFVVYVLRRAGLPADHPALRRGVAWLEAHQRASGRWFTRSLTNDRAHYITHAGTGFAVLALRACGAGSGPDDAGRDPRPSR
ncbi:MAG TPA: prenyltransferase/squalene oxidase repeat-containing protein [Isosphaeraceae bacterium]